MQDQEMHIPVVSIITPLYNKRDYIQPTIRSILQQDYTNWEWIIVDDGSTDGSTEIIPKNEPRIKLIKQTNQGPAAARNHAVQHATGEYLTFLDADDEYFPNKLYRQVETLQQYPQCAWLMAGFEVHDTRGVQLKRLPSDGHGRPIPDKVAIIDDAFVDCTQSGIHIDVLLLRRGVFQAVRGFRTDMRYLEITEFMTSLCLHYPKAVTLGEVLVRINDVPGSASKDLRVQGLAKQQIAESYIRLAKEFPLHGHRLTQKANQTLLDAAAWLRVNRTPTQARQFLRRTYSGPHNLAYWTEVSKTFLEKAYRVFMPLKREAGASVQP